LPTGAVDGGLCVLFGDALALAEAGADAEGEAEGEALRLGEADGEAEAEGGAALPGPDRSGAATCRSAVGSPSVPDSDHHAP
jgi:hypothetical protein